MTATQLRTSRQRAQSSSAPPAGSGAMDATAPPQGEPGGARCLLPQYSTVPSLAKKPPWPLGSAVWLLPKGAPSAARRSGHPGRGLRRPAGPRRAAHRVSPPPPPAPAVLTVSLPS